jgi:hypothetical protein
MAHHIWAPLKICVFDGQAVIATAQIPDTIVKYLRNAKNKIGFLGCPDGLLRYGAGTVVLIRT